MSDPCINCFGMKWHYGNNGMTPKTCKHCDGTGREPAPSPATEDDSAWIQLSTKYDREFYRCYKRDRPHVEVVDSKGRTICAFWIDEIQPQPLCASHIEDWRRPVMRSYIEYPTGYEWISRVFFEAELKGYRIVNGGRDEKGDPYITIPDKRKVAP